MFTEKIIYNKRVIKIHILENYLFKNKLFFNESTNLHDITDEELYKLCDYSIERCKKYSRFFSRRFLGSILEVIGKLGLEASTFKTILDFITDSPSTNENAVYVVASALMNLIGVVLQDKPIDEAVIIDKIKEILDIVKNGLPEDDDRLK